MNTKLRLPSCFFFVALTYLSLLAPIAGCGDDATCGDDLTCPPGDETDSESDSESSSETGFVDALRTARAVIATGGFSLMSEAVHLRVPMLAVPLLSFSNTSAIFSLISVAPNGK